MNSTSKAWIRGLAAAFIGSAASALEMSIVLPLAAPNDLSFDRHFWKVIAIIMGWASLQGAKSLFAYLKQSPLPAMVATSTSTTEVTVTETAAGGGH